MLRTFAMPLLIALKAIAAMPSPATAQTTTAATPRPEFDVVSIKQNIGADLDGSWGVNFNEYSADNTPLGRIILQAYSGQMTASTDRLKNAPAWVMDDRYDITAKVDDATANSWKGLRQQQQVALAAPLLRTMLEDRCKLVLHTVPTLIDGYALIIGKHGIRMKLSTPDEPPPPGAITFEGSLRMVPIPPDPDARQSILFQQATLDQLLTLLGAGGIPYVNQTGLTARYDFELPRRFDTPPPNSGPNVAPAPRPDAAHRFDWGALGLEMKPIKVPALDLVIDHIERPSRN